jgi:hypothetical protein
MGEFGKGCGDPQGARYVQSQFVVAALEIPHEGVSGDDDGRCWIGA